MEYRMRRIRDMKLEGRSYAEIGKTFGISRERVRQIYWQSEKLLQRRTFYACLGILRSLP